MDFLPSFSEFSNKFKKNKNQIVYTKFSADLDTPVSLMMKLAKEEKNSFLLESVTGGEIKGRYSVIGMKPDLIWKCNLEESEINRKVLEKSNNPFVLILDQINDVRNFGAIIRTAEISGVDGIIIQNSSSAPVNSDTIKTSAGAIFNIPICKVNHIKDAIYHLQSMNISIICASEKSEKNIYDVDLKVPLAIIMGSEQKGINKSVINLSNESVKLPMYGKIESLNVSVACGIFLYEVVRQRI